MSFQKSSWLNYYKEQDNTFILTAVASSVGQVLLCWISILWKEWHCISQCLNMHYRYSCTCLANSCKKRATTTGFLNELPHHLCDFFFTMTTRSHEDSFVCLCKSNLFLSPLTVLGINLLNANSAIWNSSPNKAILLLHYVCTALMNLGHWWNKSTCCNCT